jgi:hypothetical protein
VLSLLHLSFEGDPAFLRRCPQCSMIGVVRIEFEIVEENLRRFAIGVHPLFPSAAGRTAGGFSKRKFRVEVARRFIST